MVVKTLGLEHLGQLSLLPRALLQLGAFVLEPDLQLVLAQAKLRAEILPPLLRQVSVGCKLLSQPLQLIPSEGCPRPLVIQTRG